MLKYNINTGITEEVILTEAQYNQYNFIDLDSLVIYAKTEDELDLKIAEFDALRPAKSNGVKKFVLDDLELKKTFKNKQRKKWK